MTVKQLSDGNPDGVSLGQSASDKVSLYGATPVVQATVTQITTTVTGDDLAPTVKNIITALSNLGIIADA